MGINKATLSKRPIAFSMIPFPAQSLRVRGARMKMNMTDSSHIKPNNGKGKFSWKVRLFTSSRMMNGINRAELMMMGSLRLLAMLLMALIHKAQVVTERSLK